MWKPVRGPHPGPSLCDAHHSHGSYLTPLTLITLPAPHCNSPQVGRSFALRQVSEIRLRKPQVGASVAAETVESSCRGCSPPYRIQIVSNRVVSIYW